LLSSASQKESELKMFGRIETSIAAAIVLLCLASISGASGTPWPALLGSREAFAPARFRRIRSYEIHALDDDRYWGSDGDGARFLAHVLRREPRRRVLLSQGQQISPVLGTISGSALSVLDLETQEGQITPRLTAYVYIANRGAATLARVLVPTFAFIADRKFGEGLRVTAAVAEWAVDRAGGFCDWLAHEPIPSVQRDRILATLPTCAAASNSGTPRRS
jgi:hypothetical protein